jgi:hypothetical protein
MRSKQRRWLPLLIAALLIAISTAGLAQSQAARTLIPGEPISGTLDNSANIIQVYTFSGLADQTVRLTAANTLGVPLAIALTDATGAPVAQVVDNDITGDVTLEVSLTAAGVYYVTVFKSAGVGSIGSLDFTLLLTAEGGDADAPIATVAPTSDPAAALLTATLPALTPEPAVTPSVAAAPLVESTGITVSLAWDTGNDLDLEVRDPVGGSLYWRTPTVPSGGSLGPNVNQGCGVTTASATETGIWLPGGVPVGSYEVLVYFQQACIGDAPQTFTINVIANGATLDPIVGTLLPGQAYVSSFEIANDGSASLTGLAGVVDDQILPAPAGEILTAGQAQSIQIGSTVSGTISNDAPYQAYSFSAAANDIVSISMDAISGSLDTYLALLDPGGTIVRFNDDLAQGITNSAITDALLTTAGTYTIVATRYAKAVGGTEGEYALTISTQTTDLPEAFLSLPRGSLEVRLLWDSAADLQLLLRDSSGEAVFDDRPQIRSGAILGADGNVNCRAPQGDTAFSYIYYPQTIQPRLGSYEVEVWYQNACNETRPTTFTLFIGLNGREVYSATAQPLPGERFLTSFTIGADGSAAPSDGGIIRGLQTLDYLSEIENASLITSGAGANGSITPDNKFDVFVFQGAAGDVVSIAMNATSGTLDSTLYLVSPTSVQLAENDDVEPGVNKNSLIGNFTLPESGRYIIIATHFGALYGGTIGTYTLNLTLSPAAGG